MINSEQKHIFYSKDKVLQEYTSNKYVSTAVYGCELEGEMEGMGTSIFTRQWQAFLLVYT